MNNNDIGDSSPLDTSDFQLQNSSVGYGFDITQRKDSLASSLDLSEHINYIVKPQDPLGDIANRETGDPLNRTKFKESDGTNVTSDEACRLQIDSTVLPKDNLTGLPLSEVDSFKYISPPDLITNYPFSTPIEDDIPSTVKPNSTLQELKALIEEKDIQIRRLEKMVMTALEHPSFYAHHYQGNTTLSAEYFETYNHIKGLPEREIKLLLSEKDNRIRSLENMVITALQRPSFYAQTYQNQGDTMSEKSENSTYNLNNAKFGSGFAGTGGTQTGGTFYDYSSNPSLAEAATEIQQILQRLEATNPTTTSTDKRAVVNQAIDEIENNADLKARVVAALNSSSTEVLKAAINHPLAKNMMPFLEELVETN
jgi:hypothetical protein